MRRFRSARLAVALAMSLSATGGIVLSQSTAAGAALPCNITTWTGLGAIGNGTWVSAEVTYPSPYTGMLRARSSVQGDWEKFTFQNHSGWISIKSRYTGKFVTVETGYPSTDPSWGMLRARKSTVGLNEKFLPVATPFGCALIAAANNRYVSAELGYQWILTGELRARATAIGAWELFGPKALGPRFRFPVTGSVAYSDTYGAARSGGRHHAGTDIFAGGYGRPVVAVEDGKVKTGTSSLGATQSG